MKIISKYKDFYDYMVSDYEANVVYNRVPQIIPNNYNDLFGYENKSIYGQWRLTYWKSYTTLFSNVIYGIFPYVYSQPVILFRIPDLTAGQMTIIKSLTQEEFASIKSQVNLKQMILNFIDEQFAELTKHYPKISVVYHSKDEWVNAFKDNILYIAKDFPYYDEYYENFKKQCVWKKECKEVFTKIGAPVFIMYDNDLFNQSEKKPYQEIINKFCYSKANQKNGQKIQYISNVVFSQIKPNVLKYWWDDVNELQTYINIENFIAMSKLEPIANPDNKTKIINHGFDLKTSFRNM